MKSVSCLILWLFCFFCTGGVAIHPAMAADPLINLTAHDEPLGDVLETISRDTGYQFNLNGKWKAHPVSATINGLPLEKGLKRLLRSLNHSIVWESDKLITITVFGKADPGSAGSAISFSSPPQIYQEEIEPPAETESASADDPEPAEAGEEAVDSDTVAQDEVEPEPADDALTPEAGTPDEPSAELAEQTQPAADAPPSGTKVE